jgi:hypothetical protein
MLMSSNIKKTDYMDPPLKLNFHTSQASTQFYPSEILKGKLYLGDANHATSEFVI